MSSVECSPVHGVGDAFREHLTNSPLQRSPLRNETKNGFGRAVSRILSAPNFFGGENHLSGQPIPGILPRWRDWSGPLRDSLFGLAPDGVFRAVPLTRAAVVSYTTFSPLPASLARRGRFNFLWHCPSEDLSTFRPRVSRPNGPGLRGIAPCGVRTFLPRLAPGAILRPSKTKGNLAAKSMADKAGFEGGAGCWLCGDSNRIKKKT